MSFIAFINKNTYEVKDELEDYIYCDYEIKNVIATLNKKGYKTSYSCAGHNEVGLFWPLFKDDLDRIDEYLKEAETDKALHFVSMDDEYFYHKDEKVGTYIYILFDSNYNFENYPDGFDYEVFDNKSYLSKRVEFYNDESHTIRRTDDEINNDLNETHKILEDWVKSLPSI